MAEGWQALPADYQESHKFCRHCGRRMGEVLSPDPRFDARTGTRSRTGTYYWQCPEHGIGLESMLGSWAEHYEDNPHDSWFLRKS